MWVVGEVTEIWQRAEQAELFPPDPSPTDSVTGKGPGLPHPGEHLRLRPLLPNSCAEMEKNGPNEREDQNSRKNITSDEEIANLSDAQFKTLLIRMLTELVEYGHKLDEK